MTIETKIRSSIVALAFVVSALTGSASFADDAKVPATTAEHEDLAKKYKDQSTQFKKIGEEHRAMAAAYSSAHPDSKGGVKNSWNTKMQKHCLALAKDADKLAADADKAADYHSSRGKEIQGK